jgi:hypothetical protein
MNAEQFPIGSRVLLKGCAFVEPGRVLKIEHGKATVWWTDMDFISKHNPASLMLAEVAKEELCKSETA